VGGVTEELYLFTGLFKQYSRISRYVNESLKTTSRSAAQEFPKSVWNPKVHHHIYNTTPLSKIHFDIIRPPTSWFAQCSLYLRRPTNILYTFHCPMHATCTAHPHSLNHSYYTWRTVHPHYAVLYNHLSSHPSLVQIFSSAPRSLCSSHNVRDQVSHSYDVDTRPKP
jgi:hypothetical protein